MHGGLGARRTSVVVRPSPAPQQHPLPTPESTRSHASAYFAGAVRPQRHPGAPSRLPRRPRPSPAGRCPPAQGRHPPPPPPEPSRHDGRARPLQDVVRVPPGTGGLRAPRVRMQFLTHRPRPAVFLSGRSPPTAKAARPPTTTANPPPTPKPSNRPHPTGRCGGVKPCAAVPHTRGPAAFSGGAPSGGAGHTPVPRGPMQAQASQNCAFA